MKFFKKKYTGLPDRYFCLFVILSATLIVAEMAAGCRRGLELDTPRQSLEYVICQQEQLPSELQKMIENRKKKACTFSFHDTKYTYLVVCYGPQEYTGYSIQVEECEKGDHVLYLRTQLIGPSAGEPAVRRENWPWMVVRCGKTEALCLIEP